MDIRISSDIKELIFEYGAVVIPGLGSFTGSYKSASIDSVQGQLSPPSFEIIFNTNNVINDGVLVDYMKKKYGINTQEALKHIDTYTTEAFDTFSKHEILIIPEVGRLYRDYTDKIRFLPENTNFNTSTFGLPTVQFYPVSRAKVEQPVQTTTPILEKIPVTASASKATETQAKPVFPESTEHISTPLIPDKPFTLGLPFDIKKLIPALAAAIVMVLVFCIYLFNKDNKSSKKANNSSKVAVSTPPPKANDIPPSVPNPPTTNAEPAKPVAQQPKDIASEKYLESPQKNTNTEGGKVVQPTKETLPKATTPTVTNSSNATIIVGGFANKNNINRLKSWIKSQGFKVYERKSGNLTVIGAEVDYTDKKELENQLRRFKKRYGNEVEIMR